MSAFGTEKFQTTSLRLGMPSAYANAYADHGAPEEYAPDNLVGGLNEMVGNDFQAHWHQQKKADAHRMAMAKVHSTHMMYSRANSSPHNYYGMPQAVLGQRKFANPSAGSLSSGNPTRADYSDAPFHYSDAHGLSGGSNGRLVGGVLRTAQGQAYGMKLLQSRIADFDRIKEAEALFSGEAPTSAEMGVAPFAGIEPSPSDQLGLLPQIELAQLLQSILDSLDSGLGDTASSLTYKDSIRALSLIVRLATTAEAEDINDVITFLDGTSSGDGILAKLEEMVIQPLEENVKTPLYLSLKEFWERVKAYLEGMAKTVGMPLKSRTNKSQALLKSLKFTKLFSGKLPEEYIDPQDAQEAMDFGDEWSDLSSRWARSWQGTDTGTFSSSGSSRPDPRGRVIRREDSQHGYRGDGGAEFDADQRQRFGYASGEFPSGGRGVGYAGEEEVAYGDVPEEDGNSEAEDAIEQGEEEFGDNALDTIPTNAGPRLVSRRDEITGEYDVAPPAQQAPPQSSPAFNIKRADLAGLTVPQFKELAKKINAHYKNRLPDGKGSLGVSDYAKTSSIRANFIRRLRL